MEDYDKVYLVVTGAISWTITFLLTRKIFPKWSFDLCKRIVSTIHAVFAVVLCSISIQDWRCPMCPLASNSSPFQMGVSALSLAYFIYDLACCWADNNMTVDNLAHHLVRIIGIGAGLAYEMCGSEIMATLLFTEISSPFLHLREFLKELGYKNTYLNLAADASFAASFTLARMCFGPYFCYITQFSKNIPILIKAMGLGLQLVSAFWFYKITKVVNYKLIERSTSKTC
ncbi:hypothetical protein L1987_66575 [Smallanthus sonchifolius]|uniref:Uncharacterized protein n=1 Tax=Smallanthus sonchifolius TaxID=185202 RepID=A0ACB9BXP2_9ASTR|nr:hypothetical protein L1987_66575 [Smallanthus sonchifolius]